VPAKLWEALYEPVIRRAAGSQLSVAPEPGRIRSQPRLRDVLVIGAGPPASRGVTAARAGLRVIVADEDVVLGGRLLAERHAVDGKPAERLAREVAAELRRWVSAPGAHDRVRRLRRREYGASSIWPRRGRAALWKIVRVAACWPRRDRAALVFGGNDGRVMMAGAVSAYLNRFAAGQAGAVVFTTTDTAGGRRRTCRRGRRMAAVVEARSEAPPPSDGCGRPGRG